MNNTIKGLIAFALLIAVCSYTNTFAADNKYVGTTVCKMCHNADKLGKQYEVWSKTKHSKAFEALKSDAANKVAKEKGFKTPAAETPECLACHVAGGMKKADMYDAKFSKEEGVGCEACHGAGSAYKSKHQKKEQLADAKAAGMLFPKAADGSAEKLCVTCHNAKSPTHKEFKFADMWGKIKHPMPK